MNEIDCLFWTDLDFVQIMAVEMFLALDILEGRLFTI
jgi:hypothetical protein